MASNTPSSPASQNGRRSNSLVGNFMKRTRSSDMLGDRKTSNTFSRNKNGDGIQEEAAGGSAQKAPPQLPSFSPQPQLQLGERYTTQSSSTHALVTSPSLPPASPPTTTTAAVPPINHTRAESMTNRGRYSYANSTVSSMNSPRRVRRRKDPTPYNVLVIGARNSGKTSFLNFLRTSLAPQAGQQDARNPEVDTPPPSAKTNPSTFVQHYQEIDLDNERVGLSVWDSQGFEKNVLDFQLREINNFVESKFEDTFIEEMKVIRAPGYRDTHIHCVFFLFDPSQLDLNINLARKQPKEVAGSLRKSARIFGALEEDFELQILKSLQGKTTVIPVISKADTVTAAHMAHLKKMVGEGFQQAGLDPLEALHFEGYDSDDDALDEVDEEDEEAPDQLKSGQDDTPVGTNGGLTGDVTKSANADESDPSAVKEQTANTAAPRTHKRESSKVSVSSVMFDNGYMPMSILSPDEYSLDGRDGPVGRRFVWGFADPYNPQHCDFVKLKETCFTEWRADFKAASRDVFYERWRTGRLNRGTSNGLKTTTAPTTVRKTSSGIPIELHPRTKRYG